VSRWSPDCSAIGESDNLETRFGPLGYLRPDKRKLPDLYVSKDLLSRALDAASELYLRFEDARCPVGFAPSDYLTRRIELDHRSDTSTKKPEWQEDKWEPSTATVALVNKTGNTGTAMRDRMQGSRHRPREDRTDERGFATPSRPRLR
jgi:hypothetical protein